MKRVPSDVFEKLWKDSEKLACPLLRAHSDFWLYPLPEDPCRSGRCNYKTCHNYKKGFDEPDRLVVPDRPLPHLLNLESCEVLK